MTTRTFRSDAQNPIFRSVLRRQAANARGEIPMNSDRKAIAKENAKLDLAMLLADSGLTRQLPAQSKILRYIRNLINSSDTHTRH